LIGLVEKMAVASKIDSHFVLQIEEFIRQTFFVIGSRTSTLLTQVLYFAASVETRPQTEVAGQMPSKPNLPNNTRIV